MQVIPVQKTGTTEPGRDARAGTPTLERSDNVGTPETDMLDESESEADDKENYEDDENLE